MITSRLMIAIFLFCSNNNNNCNNNDNKNSSNNNIMRISKIYSEEISIRLCAS